MKAKARIAGHPIHPMLIGFPVALYVTTVVALLVHIATGDPFWYRAAMYANIAGVVMAGIAAIPGLIDLVSLPRDSRALVTGVRHAGFNVLALLLFGGSAIILYRNAEILAVAAPLVLSILGLLATVVAGWLGWTLVQTHHVGIKPSPDISGGEALGEPPMPPTYGETYRTTLRH